MILNIMLIILSSVMPHSNYNLNPSLLKHYMLLLGGTINKHDCIHQYANDMQIYFRLTPDIKFSTLSDSIILTLWMWVSMNFSTEINIKTAHTEINLGTLA